MRGQGSHAWLGIVAVVVPGASDDAVKLELIAEVRAMGG